MSLTIFSFPGTIQKTLANLSIDGNLINKLNTNRYIPNVFRYFPPEITGQTNPFTGQFLDTCENTSYLDALYCDNPYKPLIIYPFRQTLVDRVISLVPLEEIDRVLYTNEGELLEEIMDFVRTCGENNQTYTSGNAVSCDLYRVPWEATYNWNATTNEPVSANSLVLSFYDLVGFYQTSFVNYTIQNMATDYSQYRFTTNNLLNNPMGYILQRASFIFSQILNFCEQGLVGKTALLPQQYQKFWNNPLTQKQFVEKYNPTYYYGNQFVSQVRSLP